MHFMSRARRQNDDGGLRVPFAAFFSDSSGGGHLWRVFDPPRRKCVESSARVYPEVVSSRNLDQLSEKLKDLEVIFSTWGMPALTPAQLERLASLKAVFYAAGSVRHFARPFLERGVIVVTAAAANAVPVAEYTLSMVLFALKRGWAHAWNLKQARHPRGWKKLPVPGAFGSTVGLISMSLVGRRVRELLRAFDLAVLAYDPHVSPEEASRLGVELCSLEDMFRRADVVSLHAPLLPATRGLITGAMLGSMKTGATFINTARGAIVRQTEMVEVLRRREDLWAILDVADPEPPPPGSPLYELPNVILTPHIAGAMDGEVGRLADLAIEEYDSWRHGRPLRHAVSLEKLDIMG
jgi:phosphoglycerate dehydrogenase-like enzyme